MRRTALILLVALIIVGLTYKLTVDNSRNAYLDTTDDETAIMKDRTYSVNIVVQNKSAIVDLFDIQGETYLDVRSLSDWYGKPTYWDPVTQDFSVYVHGILVMGTVDEREITINGNRTVLDIPVKGIGNKPLVPMYTFVDQIGGEVIITDDVYEIKIKNYAKAASKLFRS